MNEIPLGMSRKEKIFDSNIYMYKLPSSHTYGDGVHRYEDNTYKDIYRFHSIWDGYVRTLQKF